MIKKFFLSFFALLATVVACAQQDMAQLWITMPDSIVRYLNQQQRTELVDFYNMGVKAETANLLYGTTTLDTLSTNYADIRLSESSRMQIQILEQFNGDSVICVATTFFGEEPETELSFYSSQWVPCDKEIFIDSIPYTELMAKPDTMSLETYNQLASLIDPIMLKADIIPNDFAIEFSLSTPLLRKEEKNQVRPVLKSKKVKWDGERFK